MLEIFLILFQFLKHQDKINIVDTNAASRSIQLVNCAIPKTVSSPAPICISPTPIEFAVAPIRQKITRHVTSVFNHGIFLFVTHSTIEEIDKLFPLLKHKTANAAPQTAYIAYWIKLQSTSPVLPQRYLLFLSVPVQSLLVSAYNGKLVPQSPRITIPFQFLNRLTSHTMLAYCNLVWHLFRQ